MKEFLESPHTIDDATKLVAPDIPATIPNATKGQWKSFSLRRNHLFTSIFDLGLTSTPYPLVSPEILHQHATKTLTFLSTRTFLAQCQYVLETWPDWP